MDLRPEQCYRWRQAKGRAIAPFPPPFAEPYGPAGTSPLEGARLFSQANIV
jgi:hypothetical protein